MKFKIEAINQKAFYGAINLAKWYNVLLVGFLFVGCNDKIPNLPEPKNLVEREKLVIILTEIVKLESAAKMQFEEFSDFSEVVANSGDSILSLHSVKPGDFDKSMDYYGSRQQDMIATYDAVTFNLNKEIEQLRKK